MELDNIEQTKAKNIARDITVKGIKEMISLHHKQLEEIEHLDLDLGEVGAEARRLGAKRIMRALRIKRAALGLRIKLLEERGAISNA